MKVKESVLFALPLLLCVSIQEMGKQVAASISTRLPLPPVISDKFGGAFAFQIGRRSEMLAHAVIRLRIAF